MGSDQPPSGRPPASSRGPAGPARLPAWCGGLLILAPTIATGLAAWAVAIATLPYDHDEVVRAHSIWLAAQGLRPYRDFLEIHPPYFAILAPVLRLQPGDPAAWLPRLRMWGAAGNLLFLAGLAALGASAAGSGRLWGLAGVMLVAFHPDILRFLEEFRVDSWGYALAAWGIYRFRRSPRGALREFEFGLTTGIASLWLCPKLTVLAPLVVASDLLLGRPSIRAALRSGLSYLAGVGVAASLLVLYLTGQAIGCGRAFDLVVRYNAIGNANLWTRFGLLRSILDRGVLSGAILAGVIARVVHHLRRRTRPEPYEVAVAAWLVIQPLIVHYPFKHYYAPWFLFASGFVGHLGRGLSDLLGRARPVPLLAACAVTIVADARAARGWWDAGGAWSDQRVIRWMNRVTLPEDRVVAFPPLHPIDRYDTFFAWFNHFDANGFDTGRILDRLPRFRRSVSHARAREELEAHPPALVVMTGDRRIFPLPAEQRAALKEFLRNKDYPVVRFRNVWFALRPDCYERASRDGLLSPASGG